MGKDTFALVAGGGGMTCAWAAGVFATLGIDYQLRPDMVVVSSGNAGNGAYFCAGQNDSFKRIWCELLSTKKFINGWNFFLRRPVIDIDYLVDVVFKKQEPLDVESIVRSSIDFVVPATNAITGRVRFFSEFCLDDTDRIFEVLRASKAMVMAYDKKVFIDGQGYIDTPMSALVDNNLREAVLRGANKILVVSPPIGSQSSPIERWLIRRWLWRRSEMFLQGYFNNHQVLSGLDLDDVEIFYLKPGVEIEGDISVFTRDQRKLERAFMQGYIETRENKELRDFIK